MDYYIKYKKASTYLEDREGVRRVENLYCYVRRFANIYHSEMLDETDEGDDEVQDESSECDDDEEHDESSESDDDELLGEEVYVAGFCRIEDDYAEEFFGMVDDTDEIGSDPVVKVIQGKVNGNLVEVSDQRQFLLEGRIDKDEVYVKQSELDVVSDHFGIPKSVVFKMEHLLTIEQIEKRYDPSKDMLFYPDEEEEFMAFDGFYNLSKDASQADKIHGNTLHNAVYREEVLGAAFAIMACDPRAGRTANGKVKATKLREAIDKHANRFWSNNMPPLAVATMEDLFRRWMSYVPESADQLNTAPTAPPPFPGKIDVNN